VFRLHFIFVALGDVHDLLFFHSFITAMAMRRHILFASQAAFVIFVGLSLYFGRGHLARIPRPSFLQPPSHVSDDDAGVPLNGKYLSGLVRGFLNQL
jgi:hypothetical protein